MYISSIHKLLSCSHYYFMILDECSRFKTIIFYERMRKFHNIFSLIKPKRTKDIDMRFYWLIDRMHQNQFSVYWKLGHTNIGDYHS